jgi:hypothetical protein
MPTEWLVIAVIALVALLVAADVARRSAEHGERLTGARQPGRTAHRSGPIGAVIDLVDASVAAYVVRDRLGRSTATRAERQAEADKAAVVARADEIRRLRAAADRQPTVPPSERR